MTIYIYLVTTSERISPNARYAIGDGYTRQSRAILVFISYYYTIAYVLNGRKVIAKILEIKKK